MANDVVKALASLMLRMHFSTAKQVASVFHDYAKKKGEFA